MNTALTRINSYSRPGKHKWSDALTIAESVYVILKNQPFSEQIIVLMEELNTNSNGQNLNTIRKKIAQHAWDELIQKIPYAAASEEKLTTIGAPSEERSQIHKAITSSLWNKEKRRKARSEFHDKLDSLEKNSYSKQLILYFKALYNAATKDTSELSAVSILLHQEAILDMLYKQKAFGDKTTATIYDQYILADFASEARWDI